MSDSEGEYDHEGTPRGYTPYYVAEEHDMMQLLANTFTPALMASVPGALVAVTTSLALASRTHKYSTQATLSYQGKKWVGGAKGEWCKQEYQLLSFRYVRGGLKGTGLVLPPVRDSLWGGVQSWGALSPAANVGGSENARSEERPSTAMPNVCVPFLLRATARRSHSLVR
jgi:hypothetical protein